MAQLFFYFMMHQRLFIAINIPVSDSIIRFTQKLKEKFKNDRIKWIEFKNFHITLKFLGETPSHLVPDISNTIASITENYTNFEIQIRKFGKFSSMGHAKVMWLGIDDKSKTLSKISADLNKELELYGFKPEKRNFKAHLTLARIKFIKNEHLLNDLIKTYSDKNFQSILVEELILYQSLLTPKGSVYKILEKFPF